MLPHAVKKYFSAILLDIQSSNPVLMTEIADILYKTIDLTRDIQRKLQLRQQNKGLISKLYKNIPLSGELNVQEDIEKLVNHISQIEAKIMQIEDPTKRNQLKETVVRYIKQELQSILVYEENLSEMMVLSR